jgi:hypothetical protein
MCHTACAAGDCGVNQEYDSAKCGNGALDTQETGGDSGCISNFISFFFYSLDQIVLPLLVLPAPYVQLQVVLQPGATMLASLIALVPLQTFVPVCRPYSTRYSRKRLRYY